MSGGERPERARGRDERGREGARVGMREQGREGAAWQKWICMVVKVARNGRYIVH